MQNTQNSFEQLRGEAFSQLEWIERYFSKQWLDDDYPTDKLNELLTFLLNERSNK